MRANFIAFFDFYNRLNIDIKEADFADAKSGKAAMLCVAAFLICLQFIICDNIYLKFTRLKRDINVIGFLRFISARLLIYNVVLST